MPRDYAKRSTHGKRVHSLPAKKTGPVAAFFLGGLLAVLVVYLGHMAFANWVAKKTPAETTTAQRPKEKKKRAAAPQFDFYNTLAATEIEVDDFEESTGTTVKPIAASSEPVSPVSEQKEHKQVVAAKESPVESDLAATENPHQFTAALQPTPKPPVNARDKDPKAEQRAPVVEQKPKRFLVETAAFAQRQEAERLKAQLALLGLSAHIQQAQQGRSTVFVVRLGPFGNQTTALVQSQKLKEYRIENSVVGVP